MLELVKNPHYPTLASDSAAVRDCLDLVKGVHKDGGSPVVDAEVLKNAETATKLVKDTVVITNVLFRIKVEAPRTTNPTARETMATELRDLIKAQGTDVGDDLRAELSKLGQPPGETKSSEIS